MEPPPSYTSQQDQNVLDTTITEGAINLSFCPDEGDVTLTSHHNILQTMNNTLDSSYYSMHSMKSWADNLDEETLSLGSQIGQQENRYFDYQSEHTRGDLPNNIRHSPSALHIHKEEQATQNSRFHKMPIPHRLKISNHYAGKISSRIHRAKALGRQYSSTPVLANHNPVSLQNRRVSMETSDVEYRETTDKNRNCSTSSNTCEQLRAKSAAQLAQSTSSQESGSYIQKEAGKAESITCCDSPSNIRTHSNGIQGLKFWRNNKESISTATHKSEVSIPKIFDNNARHQVASDMEPPTRKPLPGDTQKAVGLNFTPISQLYLTDMNSVRSTTSIDSWEC